MCWFMAEFGTEVLRRRVALPTDRLVPASYVGRPDQVKALVDQLCSVMMVDPGLIDLDVFDGSAAKRGAELVGKKRAVGHFHVAGGRLRIGLDQAETADPVVLTAIAVHELCHVKLLGERRINPQRSDHERLTDLLTVYFGFGIFTTNAAMRFARSARGWSIVPQGEFDDLTLNGARRNGTYNRLGYLKSPEFGYAMACFSWLRQEAEPAWARLLDPGPLTYLRQGLAFLAGSCVAGELPTQRLINRSGRVGNASISVTAAQASRLGSIGFVLPRPTTKPANPPRG